MCEPGEELRTNNDKIIKLMSELKAQRDEINNLIIKQEEEKIMLQTEMERITYKLALIAKSLAQRIQARDQYDLTIEEAEEHYKRIVLSSGELLNSVSVEANYLEDVMDKRVGTEVPEEEPPLVLNPQND